MKRMVAWSIAAMTLATSSNSHAKDAPRFEGDISATWGIDGRHMQLVAPIAFIDSKGVRWDVPKGATVDGASIPRFFWSVIGGPFGGKYRDASVIHDWYCDVRTRPWREVDRMFYEAMIARGVAVGYERNETCRKMQLKPFWM